MLIIHVAPRVGAVGASVGRHIITMLARLSSRCSVLGPVAAVVMIQAAAVARAEEKRPKCDAARRVARPIAIVDCGSGYTRVKVYRGGGGGGGDDGDGAGAGAVRSTAGRVVTAASGKHLPPLHSTLASGHADEWLARLQVAVEAEAAVDAGLNSSASGYDTNNVSGSGDAGGVNCVDVFVGATAGVRSAVEADAGLKHAVAALAAAVEARGGLGGGSAAFKLLSGEEEAALELAAARHCLLGATLRSRDYPLGAPAWPAARGVNWGNVQGLDGDLDGAALVALAERPRAGGVGLLSSGGESSQVSIRRWRSSYQAGYLRVRVQLPTNGTLRHISLLNFFSPLRAPGCLRGEGRPERARAQPPHAHQAGERPVPRGRGHCGHR